MRLINHLIIYTYSIMPYYRRRTRRPRRRRPYRKRPYRKRYARPTRSLVNNGLTIKQTFTTDFDVPASALPHDFVYQLHQFKLSDIDAQNLTSIQRLFRSFCIKKVLVKYMCVTTNPAPANETMLSKFYWQTTWDPYVASNPWTDVESGPASASRAKSKYMGKFQLTAPSATMAIVPKTATLILNPGSPQTGLVAARKYLWLDTTNNLNTLHNGIKTAFSFVEAHPAIAYQVTTTYILGLRNIV